eukprot:13970054-Ditylum_brightwellii.AAC.1
MAYSVAEAKWQAQAQLAIRKGSKRTSVENFLDTVNKLHNISVSAKTLHNGITKILTGPPLGRGRKSTAAGGFSVSGSAAAPVPATADKALAPAPAA